MPLPQRYVHHYLGNNSDLEYIFTTKEFFVSTLLVACLKRIRADTSIAKQKSFVDFEFGTTVW